jgi:Fe2+ transport system protein FeoA
LPYLELILINVAKPLVVDKEKKYIIRSFNDPEVALRMLSMGVQPGQEISIIGKSPFGDSYFISVGSRWIAARAEELDAIEWSASVQAP